MTLLEQTTVDYNDSDIKTLEWDEHIRRRPGMYIGKLGDGSHADDGIYVLLKEVLDNSMSMSWAQVRRSRSPFKTDK